jgi:G protein-coupled receptor 139
MFFFKGGNPLYLTVCFAAVVFENETTTLMLIGVAVVFIVCQLPSATLIIYNTYLEAANIDLTGNEINNLRIAGNIANILIQINAAMNFVLYSVMSTKFRRVFFRMIYRILPGKARTNQYRDATYFTGVSFSKTTAAKNYLSRSLSDRCLLPLDTCYI